MRNKIKTESIIETHKFASELANEINTQQRHFNFAVVIGLEGNLGGGKTTFTQGFAKALGVKENITSPTFVILKKFNILNSTPYYSEDILLYNKSHVAYQEINKKQRTQKNLKSTGSTFKTLIHIDAYRIQDSKEILDLGWDDLISNPENIIIVEWADKILDIMPESHKWITFNVLGENKREIVIHGK